MYIKCKRQCNIHAQFTTQRIGRMWECLWRWWDCHSCSRSSVATGAVRKPASTTFVKPFVKSDEAIVLLLNTYKIGDLAIFFL